MDGIDGIKIVPPRKGSCPVCAVAHDAGQPHDRYSLYYQVKFRQKFGRFPTWKDAMGHCDARVQEMWRKKLLERGEMIGDETDG